MERKIKANLDYGAGRYEQAEHHLVCFLHDYPYDTTAWQMLANVRKKLGKDQLAECAEKMVKVLEGIA